MKQTGQPRSLFIDQNGPCSALEDQIVVGLLPSTLFENGLTFFVQRLPQNLGVAPYAVHGSYIAGTFNKIHHLRESLLWHVSFWPASISICIFLGERYW